MNSADNATVFQWEGDLNDDCSAWHERLLLRAEQMDEEYWWWAVSEGVQPNRFKEIASSNDDGAPTCKNGPEARASAEAVARHYLETKKRPE